MCVVVVVVVGDFGRFVLRANAQPVGVLTKQLLRGGERENFGRFVRQGKAQPVGVLTKQLSRQGRERDNLGRKVLRGNAQPVGVLCGDINQGIEHKARRASVPVSSSSL